jgi:hypothetical protein
MHLLAAGFTVGLLLRHRTSERLKALSVLAVGKFYSY